jgi:hypothetical protein
MMSWRRPASAINQYQLLGNQPVNGLDTLLFVIDQAFDHKSWHGTNLRGSIRGLNAVQANWRAQPTRKNIHEIILHCAYWKYTVRRRFTGENRGSFPLRGSNWFTRPLHQADDEKEWKASVRLLVDAHHHLREAIANVTESQLHHSAPGGSTLILELIAGIAAHDLYHAGQIQTLKRLRAGDQTGCE